MAIPSCKTLRKRSKRERCSCVFIVNVLLDSRKGISWGHGTPCMHCRYFCPNYMTLEFDCICSLPIYHIFRIHFHRRKQNKNKYEPKRKIMHSVLVSLKVVDHLLLGNEMRGFVDQRHERVEFVRPVVEQVVGVFGPLKVDDASQPVDLGIDGLVYN